VLGNYLITESVPPKSLELKCPAEKIYWHRREGTADVMMSTLSALEVKRFDGQDVWLRNCMFFFFLTPFFHDCMFGAIVGSLFAFGQPCGRIYIS